MFQAIVNGNIDYVRGHIHSMKNESGYTPLMIAALNEQYDIVDLLSDDINKTDDRGNTPLMVVCGKRSLRMVTHLLDHGADITLTNSIGDTAISIACRSNYLDLIILLINRGANINVVDRFGIPLLVHICHLDYKVGLELLCNIDPNIRDKAGRTLIMLLYEYRDILMQLLNNGADVNAVDRAGNSILSIICDKGDYDFIDFILSKGATSSASQALCNVCANNYLSMKQKYEIAEVLLAMDSNLNSNPALLYACTCGLYDLSKLLLQHGANPNYRNTKGNTPIKCVRQNTRLLELLFQYGAKPTINNGIIPEYTAFYSEQNISIALKYGFDLNERRVNGETALMMIVKSRPDIVLKLDLDKLDLNIQDDNGWTVLMHLVHYTNNTKAMTHLLQHGANPDVQDNDGNTILMKTIEFRWLDSFGLTLIKHGANVNIQNNKGSIALDVFIYERRYSTLDPSYLLMELLKKSELNKQRISYLPYDKKLLRILIRRGIKIKTLMKIYPFDLNYLINIEHKLTLSERAANAIQENELKEALKNDIIPRELILKYRDGIV